MSEAPKFKMLTPNGGFPTGSGWEDHDLVKYIRADLCPAATEIDNLRATNMELTAQLAKEREVALREAHDAVAKVMSPIEGTPYSAGPRLFCEAILALLDHPG